MSSREADELTWELDPAVWPVSQRDPITRVGDIVIDWRAREAQRG